jgi:hypothetical protein
MCFGGGNNSPPPPPAAPNVGVIDVNKVAPDPSQAGPWRGGQAAPNDTGRVGGGLLVDAALKAPKTSLGGL